MVVLLSHAKARAIHLYRRRREYLVPACDKQLTADQLTDPCRAQILTHSLAPSSRRCTQRRARYCSKESSSCLYLCSKDRVGSAGNEPTSLTHHLEIQILRLLSRRMYAQSLEQLAALSSERIGQRRRLISARNIFERTFKQVLSHAAVRDRHDLAQHTQTGSHSHHRSCGIEELVPKTRVR